MRVLECDAERRVEVYNAIVELKAAHIDTATAFSELQHRYGVSQDDQAHALHGVQGKKDSDAAGERARRAQRERTLDHH